MHTALLLACNEDDVAPVFDSEASSADISGDLALLVAG